MSENPPALYVYRYVDIPLILFISLYRIGLLRTFGVLDREYRRHYRNVFDDQMSPKLSVALNDTVPIFCIIVSGILAGAAIMVVECVYHFTKNVYLKEPILLKNTNLKITPKYTSELYPAYNVHY